MGAPKPRKLAPKGDEIRARRLDIVRILRENSDRPMTAVEIHRKLVGSHLRAVQRDLQVLEELKYVLLKKQGGWIVGEKPYEEEFEKLFSALALDVFCKILKETIPAELKREVEYALKSAVTRLEVSKATNPQHPAFRWANALRVEKPYTLFDQPQIDTDVRYAIEEAIISRRKVMLTLRVGAFGPRAAGPAIASISHFIINLPDRPTVVAWYDDDKDDVRPDNEPTCYHIPLETIELAEIRDEVASWPGDYDPPIFETLVGQRDDSWELIEFRVDPYLIEKWIGSWIGCHMEVIGIDDEGWSVCRMDFPYWNRKLKDWGGERDNLMEYLLSHGGDVEILSPYHIRQGVLSGLERQAATYRKCQAVPKEIEERWENEHDERLSRVVVGFDLDSAGNWVKRLDS